jgi:hypothetical protein
VPACSRRLLLAGLAGLAAAGGLAPWPRAGQAAPQSAPQAAPLPPQVAATLRLSRLAVDVGPLRALGVGVNADILAAAMAAQLRVSFADRLAPGDMRAPALVVRLSSLSLSSSFAGGAGGARRGIGGSGDSDYLEGVGLIVDGRGGVIATYPMLSALASSASGAAWYDPHLQQRRLEALAGHYAAWMRRTIVGRP